MLVFSLVILMLFAGAGIQLVQINNYVHETQEVIGRYGGLNKDAAYKLQLDSENRYGSRFEVTTFKPNKQGNAVYGEPYLKSNDLQKYLTKKGISKESLADTLSKKILDDPSIEGIEASSDILGDKDIKPNDKYKGLNDLGQIMKMRGEIDTVKDQENHIVDGNELKKLDDKINNLKKQIKDLTPAALTQIKTVELEKINTILSSTEKAGGDYPLTLKWRQTVGQILNTKQDQIFNTDTAAYGDDFTYTVWFKFNLMNTNVIKIPIVETVTNESRQGTVGGGNDLPNIFH